MMIFEWRKEFGFFEGGGVAAAGWYKLLFFNDARWKEERRKLEREREKDRGKKERGRKREETVFVPSLSFLTSSSTQQVPVPFNEKICERGNLIQSPSIEP